MLTVPAEPTRRDDEPHRPIRQFRPGPLLLAALIFVAALTRLLPHPLNFSPVRAIALFGGAYFALAQVGAAGAAGGPAGVRPRARRDARRHLPAVLHHRHLPPSLLAIYACVALCSLLGFGLRGRVNGSRVLGYSLAGSVLFFVLSNFATWLTAIAVPGYPASVNAGLGALLRRRHPVLPVDRAGTLFPRGVAVRRLRPAAAKCRLRAQTV